MHVDDIKSDILPNELDYRNFKGKSYLEKPVDQGDCGA